MYSEKRDLLILKTALLAFLHKRSTAAEKLPDGLNSILEYLINTFNTIIFKMNIIKKSTAFIKDNNLCFVAVQLKFRARIPFTQNPFNCTEMFAKLTGFHGMNVC